MQQCWIRGHRRVVFEGDCQILVNALQKNTARFDILNWLYEINEWEMKFEEVVHIWIPRHLSHTADRLVKEYRPEMSDFLFYFYIPHCISDLLHYHFVVSS